MASDIDAEFSVPANRRWIVDAVIDHAREHYSEGGWDMIYEGWTSTAIYDQIGKARTVKGAIAKFEDIVAVYAERDADAINSAF